MKFSLAAVLIAFLALQGCNAGSSTGQSGSERYRSRVSVDEDDNIEDELGDEKEEVAEGSNDDGGSGNVHYYNPNTGTNSDYTLDVEHDGNGDVERINFDSGGYIDESHIAYQEHNGDGTITVTTDKGYEYTVDESSDDASSSESEDE